MMTKKCSKKCYKKFQMHLKVAHRGMTLKTIPRKNRKRKKKLRVKLICLMTNANNELPLLSCICIIFIECHAILLKFHPTTFQYQNDTKHHSPLHDEFLVHCVFIFLTIFLFVKVKKYRSKITKFERKF